MIKAIVYLTNTGSTGRYSEMLSEATGLPAFSLREAGDHLKLNDEIFYLGWVVQGRIKGYNRAALRYSIVGACAVGMNPQEGDTAKKIKDKTGITNPRIKVFYARGAFDMDKLDAVHRLFMGIVLKTLKENKGDKNLIRLIEKGGDFVERGNIKAAADWITGYNRRFGEQG